MELVLRIRVRAVPALALLAGFLLAARPALAERPRTVAVLRATTHDARLDRLASAVDLVVPARVGERGIAVAAQPALDLEGVQLVGDCMGQTPQCLRAVAEALGADALIVPSLKRSGGETVLTILYFEARTGEIRSAARQHGGDQVDRGILDDVRDVLQELLQPEAARKAVRVQPSPVSAPAPAPRAAPPAPRADLAAGEGARDPVPSALPVALTVGGGLMAVGGLVLTFVAAQSEREFERAPVDTPHEVDAAYDKLETARDQRTLANVGLAVGGAALATGIALFAW